MRACFVSLSIYGYFEQSAYAEATGGGAQRQLYLLAQRLAEDHDIHFVVGDYGQEQRVVQDGVTLHRAFRPVGSTMKKPLEVWKLYRAMRQADADIYVSRNKPSVAVVSYLCARLQGKRWVFNVANDRFVQQDLRYLATPLRKSYQYALGHADSIVAQTPRQQISLQDFFGVDSTVVPNGYTRVEEITNYEDRDHFLWVGHLDPEQKRPTEFLKLAKQVPEAEFLLVGARGSEQLRESLRAELEELDNADYAFDVPPDEVHQYYKRALALVSTSSHEGFPNTYLEAWRAGTPVLALSVDPDRFLQQGEPGEFVADGLSDLAARVKALQSNQEYWRGVSDNVQQAFERQYSIEDVAEQYAEALKTALK